MFISELFNYADYSPASKIRETKDKISASEDPCWKGYHMVGTKSKDGKQVPNCVPGEKGAMNETTHLSDMLQARDLIVQALRDSQTKQQYFDFLKFLRSKHGAEYSTQVHQQAAKLAQGSN